MSTKPLRRLLLLLLATLLVSIQFAPQAHALIPEQKRLLNDTVYWFNYKAEEPGACGVAVGPGGTGGAVGGAVTSDKGKAVYDFFVAKGLPPFMSASILGNLVAESGLNSGIENRIGAYGLAQWLGGRKTDLQSFARGQGKPVSDFNMQLEFIWLEFNGKEKSAFNAIKATSSLEDIPGGKEGAVRVVMEKYERPSPAEQRDSFQKRLNAAKKGLETHGNGAPSTGNPLITSPDPGGAPVSGAACAAAGGGGNFTGAPGQTEPKGKGFTLANNTNYADTPCAPGTTETQIYKHPVRNFQIRLCKVGNTSIVVASIVSDRVLSMVNDAKGAGISLNGAAFRTYERQISLRSQNGCNQPGGPSNAGCSPPTAVPGNSQHERGLAIDFSRSGGSLTRSTEEFKWLAANAARYGYYNFAVEPWHWSPSGT